MKLKNFLARLPNYALPILAWLIVAACGTVVIMTYYCTIWLIQAVRGF